MLKLNVFALWAYDVIWTIARAAEEIGVVNNASVQKPNSKKGTVSLESLETSPNGPKLLNVILQNRFKGLSGYFDLSDWQLQASTFRIINVVRKQSKEIGLWTAQGGIPLQLNPVTWPGESTKVPRGWEVPVRGKKLQIGVRNSGYLEFMKVHKDPITDAIKPTGLSIDVFEEAVKRLPYALPYEYVEFAAHDPRRSYDDIVYQVYLKNYDAAVGDITIRYNRSLYVDLTLPYTESGVAMVVSVKPSETKNTWIFTRPLSKGLWFGSIGLFVSTGGVVWVLEYLGGNEELGASLHERLVIMIFFLPFSTELKDKVKGFLSRIVLLVWLFFLLVLTSSYTASLASMLTVQQLRPTVTDVHELIKSNEYVGYHSRSYVKGLLQEIGFDRSKTKPYDTPEEFHNALSSGSKNGGIAALVHEVPYIKLFLAKHCKEYTMVGPIYKTAGFGYAFPKGSPLLDDMSRAILNITGGDTIIQIEKKWTADQNNCQNAVPTNDPGSLTLDSFRGLFILTGGVSAGCLYIGLAICLIKRRYQLNNLDHDYHDGGGHQGEHGEDENDQEHANGMPQDGAEGGIRQEDDQGGRGQEINQQAHEPGVTEDGVEIRVIEDGSVTYASSSTETADRLSVLTRRGSGSSRAETAEKLVLTRRGLGRSNSAQLTARKLSSA
ncbi:hypothetical protein ACP70R_034504 [Stipagrostis hirtigluma subsp. patula]